MPTDLRSPAPAPAPPRRRPLRTLTRPSPSSVFLFSFLAALYLVAALRFALPPFASSSLAQADRVLRSRPALRNVERYSPEFKYRPAASPVVQVVGPDGKKHVRGKYY